LHQVGLAREQGFIGIDPSLADYSAIHHDLVSWSRHEQIPNDQSICINRVLMARPDRGGGGMREQGDAIEGALGTDFLDDTHYEAEGDHGHRGNGIERATEQEQDSTKREQDEIDKGPDVLPGVRP
jgi:hypothetical protein